MLSIHKLTTGHGRYYIDGADGRVDFVESIGDEVEEYYAGPSTEARGTWTGMTIHERASRPDEHQVVLVCPGAALAQRSQHCRDLRRQRHRPHLARLRRRERSVGVGRPHADHLAGEVDVAPAERSIPAIQRSIAGVVIDSIGRSPNAGSNCERTSAR